MVLNADQTYPIGDRDSQLDGSNVCGREHDDGTSGDNDLYGDGARLQDKKKKLRQMMCELNHEHRGMFILSYREREKESIGNTKG